MSERREADGLLDEASLARALIEGEPDVIVDHRRMISTTMLAHTLFALWDSGFYEHVRAHDVVSASDARILGYEPAVFEVILHYLVGHSVLTPRDAGFVLTEYGQSLHNVFTRGLIKLYVGGYGPLLSNLGSALRGELPLSDPRLKRLPRAVASGTEDINCVHTVPAVIEMLRREGARCVLDLGCGTGGFLIRLASSDPSLSGIGIDLEAEAVGAAREAAKKHGLESRLDFHCAAVGAAPMDIPAAVLQRVDTVSCMFLLHEFGRGGQAAIVDVVRAIAAQLPGRRLVVLESDPADPFALGRRRPPHLGHLDYWYVHPLSLQGPPMSSDAWEHLFMSAGAKSVSHHTTFPSSIARIYRIQL